MKIQSPWMGRIKGSAGNMTGCKVYDKNVMRAKAFEVNNPNTAAQQVQRGYFADLTKLVAGFTPDQLRTLFPSKPKAMSRRNALSKQLAEYFDFEGSKKVVDYQAIDTLGNASTMDFGQISIVWDETNILVTLDESVETNQTLADFYYFNVLVNITKGEISMSPSFALVSENDIVIPSPSGWEQTDTIHAIPCITDAKTAPTGFGTISVTKRPVKKSN